MHADLCNVPDMGLANRTTTQYRVATVNKSYGDSSYLVDIMDQRSDGKSCLNIVNVETRTHVGDHQLAAVGGDYVTTGGRVGAVRSGLCSTARARARVRAREEARDKLPGKRQSKVESGESKSGYQGGEKT